MKRRLKLIYILCISEFAGGFDGDAAFGDIMILQIPILVGHKCYLNKDTQVSICAKNPAGREQEGRDGRD